MHIFIYGHSIKDSEDLIYIKLLIQLLTEEKVVFYLYTPFAKELTKAGLQVADIETIAITKELKEKNIDVAITLGGDGTILHAITLVKDTEIPILGINLGRLGFLAIIEKKIIAEAIYQLIHRQYTIENRSLLKLECSIPLFNHFPYALNDFTINKRDTSSMITIHTYIDDELLNSYWADGIIISTPTGSTGYSLSCGGPIIFPNSRNFVITPVAPHNLNVRPIVIPDSNRIKVVVEGRTDSFMCTLDSRYETITSAHQMEISKGSFDIGFIKLEGQTFMNTLSDKLLWGLDKRN